MDPWPGHDATDAVAQLGPGPGVTPGIESRPKVVVTGVRIFATKALSHHGDAQIMKLEGGQQAAGRVVAHGFSLSWRHARGTGFV